MARWESLVFGVSALVVGAAYGTAAALQGWFPFPQAEAGLRTYHDLREHWRNDLDLEPTRHLVPVRDPQQPVFAAPRPELAAGGRTIIAGMIPGREVLHGAVLLDPTGAEIHYWPIDYAVIAPDGRAPSNVTVHGLELDPDGSIVVTFDEGDALTRLDACGTPIWVDRHRYHHTVERDDAGHIWTWRDDTIVQVDGTSGATLTEIDLQRDIMEPHALEGVLAIRTFESQEGLHYLVDPWHSNDVEPLSAALAPAFPMFEAGDLVISLREINLVAVVDPVTHALKWYRHGPWFKQHDPDFLPDGRISVYDNRMGLGGARIIVIDPATNEWETVLAEGPDLPFESWRRGKHEHLPNGNILVAESEQGRVFEATRAGELVWAYENRFDDTRNAVVTSADHVPDGFLEDGALDCAANVAAAEEAGAAR